MYSTIKTITLICAFVLAATTARSVSPPPDGGYPNGNTAEGEKALLSLNKGSANTAVGFEALWNDTNGNSNTGIGFQALHSAKTSVNNTAIGANALFTTHGSNNTATGYEALFSNDGGSGNTANGVSALLLNTSGSHNTAIGSGAMFNNTVGFYNTATGENALVSNSAGNYNTAYGPNALLNNRMGSNNNAVGFLALFNTTGDNNIAIGASAGSNLTTGNFNIDIANSGVAGESNTIRIGTEGTQTVTYVAGISGATVPGGVGVIIDANGHLGTVVSSERFKDAIKPMDKASEAILALKPVTFHYKHELDPDAIPQFGLVAEQVEKVNPDLVARDDQGKPYTVRYEAVNAMLLNEFLKAHATIGELKSLVAKQQEQITALASQIKTVSNRLELSKDATRVVATTEP